MDFVQTAAATTANVLMPGSGALVNTGFELAKICFQIAQILSGMEGKASSIKTQQINIKEDVENFRWVLEMLERVQNQDKLTDGLQKMIARFETEREAPHRPVSLEEQVEERDKRYMEYVDSREVMEAMSDSESQKEMLAIIARMGRRDDALMEDSTDRVVSVMKENSGLILVAAFVQTSPASRPGT
ncbi:hypothetical protein PC118_g9636 [Phytophthora cactorum]|uniref:Uncharacterized protein n=1 Tax=Phytophthora cactorum TaxID=29920 RepID=A0A8T0Z8A1_9STRA|nr:hypothetical protein PC113_g9832 [Phytophthora cactorum]KAG2983073.1 hypothetical protein PC118_g9636 [Phytophthora cactorum]